MTDIELIEYKDSEPLKLTNEERDAIDKALRGENEAGGNYVRYEPGATGYYRINPGNNVGTITVGKKKFYIKPKLPIEHIYWLATYSLKSLRHGKISTNLNDAKYFHELIAIVFAEYAEAATKRCLLHSYRPIDEASTTIRGRIRIEDQIARRGRLLIPIEITHDEFTPDCEENRRLLAACKKLLHLKRIQESTKQKLKKIIHRLYEVTDCYYPKGSLNEIHINRLNRHYEKALDLSSIILNSGSLEWGYGSVKGLDLLANMEKVFEDFTQTALKEALSLTDNQFPRNAANKNFYLDGGKEISLEPDFSWWLNEKCIAIGDMKYKKAIPNTSDLYQLLAYQSAADLDNGFLIYAATNKDNKDLSYQIRNSNKVIHVEVLHLNGTPEEVLARVNIIAEKIRSSTRLALTTAA